MILSEEEKESEITEEMSVLKGRRRYEMRNMVTKLRKGRKSKVFIFLYSFYFMEITNQFDSCICAKYVVRPTHCFQHTIVYIMAKLDIDLFDGCQAN